MTDRIFFNVITCASGKAWSVHDLGDLRRWAVEAESESGARARLERRGHTIHAVCSIYPIDPKDPRIDQVLYFHNTQLEDCLEGGA